jgi:hypothetical protein
MAMLTRKGQDLLAVVALMGMLAVASTVAMMSIGVSQQPIDPMLNPSPLGYTWSLALFALPCVVFGVWVAGSARTAEQRRACGLTLLLLIPLGFILDVFFGRTFLRFPNHAATVGLLLPAYDLRRGWHDLWGPGWTPFFPVEEFAFYALGFLPTLVWRSRTAVLSDRPAATCVALGEAWHIVSHDCLTSMLPADWSGPRRLELAWRTLCVWARGSRSSADTGVPTPLATAMEGRAWVCSSQQHKPG